MTPAERGRRGGLATLARHGTTHMAQIGKRGFAAYAERCHGGNRKAAWLALDDAGRMRRAGESEACRQQRASEAVNRWIDDDDDDEDLPF